MMDTWVTIWTLREEMLVMSPIIQGVNKTLRISIVVLVTEMFLVLLLRG